MIDHISLQTDDFDAAIAWYDAVLTPLGYSRVMDFPGAAGYGPAVGVPEFWLGQATDAGGRQTHVAFSAADRDQVRAFFRVAVELGSEVLHEPRVWPEYHPDYYGAFVRDPDGNNVEAVCHRPAA
jgi:catechol 2,3-dioxygenase-like lactoylglutathione lyase family enzyme